MQSTYVAKEANKWQLSKGRRHSDHHTYNADI